jgi:hypothetical protein
LRSTDIGFANSNFGTMQTEGSPIRPKYYLSTKKYGQRINLLEQGKDGKTVQDIKTTRNVGFLNAFTGGALESPVKITFVSGSSDALAGSIYSESTPSDAVNKTINSVLTGAFYDKP